MRKKYSTTIGIHKVYKKILPNHMIRFLELVFANLSRRKKKVIEVHSKSRVA